MAIALLGVRRPSPGRKRPGESRGMVNRPGYLRRAYYGPAARVSVPRFSFALTGDDGQLVTRAVRIVSAARCVICSGSSTNRGAYRNAGGHSFQVDPATRYNDDLNAYIERRRKRFRETGE
jgi:hypothetical protein